MRHPAWVRHIQKTQLSNKPRAERLTVGNCSPRGATHQNTHLVALSALAHTQYLHKRTCIWIIEILNRTFAHTRAPPPKVSNINKTEHPVKPSSLFLSSTPLSFSDTATTDRLLFSGLVCNRGYSQLRLGCVAVAITVLLCCVYDDRVSSSSSRSSSSTSSRTAWSQIDYCTTVQRQYSPKYSFSVKIHDRNERLWKHCMLICSILWPFEC